MSDAGSRISGSDLFIKVSANKKRVYEQEPILLTYKVYTLVDLTQLEGKMPELKGFHTQEVDLPQPEEFQDRNCQLPAVSHGDVEPVCDVPPDDGQTDDSQHHLQWYRGAAEP